MDSSYHNLIWSLTYANRYVLIPFWDQSTNQANKNPPTLSGFNNSKKKNLKSTKITHVHIIMQVPNRPTLVSLFLATAVLCACVTMASTSDENSHHNLNQLMGLLGKFKNAQRATRHPSSGNSPLSSSSGIALTGTVQDDNDFLPMTSNGDDDESIVNKRQGSWSLDYGLGGGRFGKRGYADYGLGGGRYGRDVDHVDPNHDFDVL